MSNTPIKKFSDRLNDLVTIINPLAYMVFKDNPIVIMFMPIFVFIIRQIEEFFGSSARTYKDAFPNLASIVINDMYNYQKSSKSYTHVSWYISKEYKIDKCEATVYLSDMAHFESGDDVIGSLKYKNDTIFFQFEINKLTSHNDRKITLYSKSNNIQILKDFVTMCAKEYLSETNNKDQDSKKTYQLMQYSSGSWLASHINVPKTKRNTFLTEEQSNIFNIVDRFLQSEDVYIDHGIPYKKGILLHGMPGTGKSSIGYALAHTFNLNIYKLDYKCLESESNFVKAINDIPSKSLVIIEDIDTYKFAKDRRNQKNNSNPIEESAETLNNISKNLDTILTSTEGDDKSHSSLSLSSLNSIQMESVLHALDGYTCLHGCIIIFTTNYMNRVDSAMLRPGRIDHHYEFTYADSNQIKNILEYFEQEHLINKYIIDDKPIQITTAELIQNVLVTFINKLENNSNIT